MDIKRFGFYFLFMIILLVALKFYSIVYDFFPSIAAACVFAYVFNPLYRYFLRLTKRRAVSGSIVIAIVFFLILVPVTLIIIAVQKQMEFLFDEKTFANVQAIFENFDVTIKGKLPFDGLEKYVESPLSEMGKGILNAVQKGIAIAGPKMFMGVTRALLSTFITIFVMYYLMTNSRQVIGIFQDYFPISYKNCDILLDEIGRQTRALIYGQLLISIIQGSLGGLGFLLFGINGALFWGLIMMIGSLVPLAGATIIWFPAVLLLAAKGEYYNAVGLLLWGTLVVGTVDNLIRPKLTETIGKIHPVTVLLGVLMGIKEWGFIGVVIGPVIISTLMILIKMFREEYLVESGTISRDIEP